MLVVTNGCLDLIHPGHIRSPTAARQLGRSLVMVEVNSDRSVQTLQPKTPRKPACPIIPEAQRAEVLAALKPVRHVEIPTSTSAIIQRLAEGTRDREQTQNR